MLPVFLVALVLGVAVGWLRRGSLLNLEHLPLRFLWLVPIALGLRFLAGRGTIGTESGNGQVALLLAGSFLLLLAAVVVNRRLPGMGLLAAGAILNLIVIMANDGRMPVSPAALNVVRQEDLVRSLAEDREPAYTLLTPETRLPFLADVLYLPPALGLDKFFSFGDILIWLAIIHMVQSAMQVQRNIGSDRRTDS